LIIPPEADGVSITEGALLLEAADVLSLASLNVVYVVSPCLHAAFLQGYAKGEVLMEQHSVATAISATPQPSALREKTVAAGKCFTTKLGTHVL
jgi:hypothetical protein